MVPQREPTTLEFCGGIYYAIDIVVIDIIHSIPVSLPPWSAPLRVWLPWPHL
jgi:hypothetical protein